MTTGDETTGDKTTDHDPEAGAPRPRGRPRLDIDHDAVADAVADLFAEGGYDAVTIADTAARLSVSRSTLYRAVPTKGDLLGILLERGTREATDQATALVETHRGDPAAQLRGIIQLHVHNAVRMRHYLPLFFDRGDLPPDVYERWRTFSRDFERLWTDVVRRAMDTGVLEPADPVVATRLLLGMCLWVSHWYRNDGRYDADEIADVAISLLRTQLLAESPVS